MLDRLGRRAVRRTRRAAAAARPTLAQELDEHAERRHAAPAICRSPSKGDIALKKIGLELIVRVDGQKRTIMLPPALAEHRAAGAKLSDGVLLISFQARRDRRRRGELSSRCPSPTTTPIRTRSPR